jgi:hypothetical protein
MQTRRAFSRTTIAAAAGTALSAGRVWGANDRVRMGLIGSGGRGREDWGNFLKQPEVDPVAVCDVYDPHREQGIALSPKAAPNRSRIFAVCWMKKKSTR